MLQYQPGESENPRGRPKGNATLKKTPKKNVGGRPRAVIDWRLVERLCKLQCTAVEICSTLDLGYDALVDNIQREYGISFPEYFAQKSAARKISLRRLQYKAAMGGSIPMLIWLGKQWLNQSDKITQDNTGSDGSLKRVTRIIIRGAEVKKPD